MDKILKYILKGLEMGCISVSPFGKDNGFRNLIFRMDHSNVTSIWCNLNVVKKSFPQVPSHSLMPVSFNFDSFTTAPTSLQSEIEVTHFLNSLSILVLMLSVSLFDL